MGSNRRGTPLGDYALVEFVGGKLQVLKHHK
jgi:hypothetical protein